MLPEAGLVGLEQTADLLALVSLHRLQEAVPQSERRAHRHNQGGSGLTHSHALDQALSLLEEALLAVEIGQPRARSWSASPMRSTEFGDLGCGDLTPTLADCSAVCRACGLEGPGEFAAVLPNRRRSFERTRAVWRVNPCEITGSVLAVASTTYTR